MPGKTSKWFDFYSKQHVPNVSSISRDYQEALSRIQANDKTLTQIMLSAHDLKDADITLLCELLQKYDHPLTSLDLSYNRLTNNSAAVLVHIIVSKLNLSGTQIDKDGIDLLLTNVSINSLTMRQNHLKSLNPETFTQTHQLTHLDLQSNDLHGDAIRAIIKSKKLIQVNLSANKLKVEDLNLLALASFQELILRFNSITDNDIVVFSENVTLKELDISQNCLTDRGMASLAKMNLTYLNIACSTKLSINGVQCFRSHPTLSKISLKPGNQNISLESVMDINNSLVKSSMINPMRYILNLFSTPRIMARAENNYQPLPTINHLGPSFKGL